MQDLMQDLVRWYWNLGINRGKDEQDPDRELRKMSIEGWLDPLVRIIERNNDIKRNANGKCCLALWGPSQTGKSTMMSRYIDGNQADGSDSALTWDPTKKTRFSPSISRVVPDGTLVFNPFNQQSDASGVATRYVLKESSSGEVNPQFPVEIRLTSRAQIIQSLSLGYLSECKIRGEDIVFTRESFLQQDELGTTGTCTPDEKAYLVLKDIADVIENMRGERRFNNLFRTGEWEKKIRRVLVAAPEMLASPEKAEKFLTKLFWDSEQKLTKVYKEINRLLSSLLDEWGNCKILATLEVGALILDIDSYQQYVSPKDDNGERTKRKIDGLAFERVGNEVHIFLQNNSSNSLISGRNFGYFQALCSELVVPMKKEAIGSSPSKASFLALASKCDFLDFPGVSNKNAGSNVENATGVDLGICEEPEILTRVFKQGKTQCFVYNYVKRYGIDAFAVLVRTDRYPSKSTLLNAGIGEWLRSFDKEWKPGETAPMPVFVNMTFFGSLINNVSLNPRNGLSPVIQRIQGELNFASKKSAQFFPTTYQQFPDGKIQSPDTSVIDVITHDADFIDATGMKRDAIAAVYEEDGGVNYMLDHIGLCIDPNKRRNVCRHLLEDDEKVFKRLIKENLPSEDDTRLGQRKEKLRQCADELKAKIAEAQALEDIDKYCEYANEIQDMFSASPDIFDSIPCNAADKYRKEINTFIRSQIAIWYDYKMANIAASSVWNEEEQKLILGALRDSFGKNELELLFDLIFRQLGNLNDKELAKAARYPFAVVFNNILKSGKATLESTATLEDRTPDSLEKYIKAKSLQDCDYENSPYYHTILKPLLARMDKLTEKVTEPKRPPQIGDKELAELYNQILASAIFQMN